MTKSPLPPDPEGMNNDRAEWALEAIEAFRSVTGAEYDTAIYDLLCDLMHLCDRTEDWSFDAALRMAKRHYKEETTNPPF